MKVRFPLQRRRFDETRGIAAGQRFRSAGAVPILWEVLAIARYPWEAAPHVRLQRVGAPDAKTIALGVLLDDRFYLPAG